MASGRNLVLIGMPGAGKSTVGVLLAKALKMPFTDTDILIHAGRTATCRAIEEHGIEVLSGSRRAVKSLDLNNHVIATGGSVVSSKPPWPT